ncbi:Smr/MutS family protein [Pararhodobacter oceanensis]|uniref:Smr/MutS family protein n=1 Tax=Pararhodobacter oceanensis TaxID=2172121 RepID=UPI003A92C71D
MPRRLTDDDKELWQRVARSTTPLQPMPSPKPDRRKAPLPDPQAPEPAASFTPASIPQQIPAAMPPRSAKQVAKQATAHPARPRINLDLAEPVARQLARAPVAMERKLHKHMMRGKLLPEARIDLHGMTVAQAHQALIGFILSSQARGLRLVLVITGKGRKKAPDYVAPMPVRAGVLKHEVPQWLRAAPLGPLVQELRESHQKHGGAGAYYVSRRNRR